MVKFSCAFLMFIGRLCIAAIFILSGVGKFFNWDQTAAYMASKGLTMVPLFLIGAALVEIIGGLTLVFGYKTRWGATLLLLYLIPTTVIFHDFWNQSGAEYMTQQIEFLKNLAIFGGLLYVISVGSGGCAVDACCCKAKKPEDVKLPEDQDKKY